MLNITLQRMGETPHSTWGNLFDAGPGGMPLCKILERGASNPDHVRIPAGAYQIDRKKIGQSEFDKTFGEIIGANYKGILWLPDVPGRSNIEIHTANFVEQLLGCLATATEITKDGAGYFAAAQSRAAYIPVYKAISPAVDAGGVTLTIRDIVPAAIA